MKEKGITYDELQFLTKLSPATIASSRKKTIGSCSLNTLEKIALAMNINVKDLFDHRPASKAAMFDAN